MNIVIIIIKIKTLFVEMKIMIFGNVLIILVSKIISLSSS